MSWITRFPATTSAAILLLALVAWFGGLGAYAPDELPVFSRSRREVIGMAAMLTILPPYLIAAVITLHRFGRGLIEQLRPWLPEPSAAERAADSLAHGWRRALPWGLLIGLAMGVVNTSPIAVLEATQAPRVHLAISFGQMFLWATIGLLLAVRVRAARVFRQLGREVEFDVLRLERLKPLARSGLADVLVIAGALAFSPLQSLDAEFRWYNYQFGLGIAVIGASLLLVWPLWPIHQRIAEAKRRAIVDLEARIEASPDGGTIDGLVRLETLLAHRDRLERQTTWLVSTELVWRFLLYLVIPPLAWIGAAIVERGVDALLAG